MFIFQIVILMISKKGRFDWNIVRNVTDAEGTYKHML